jgi:copper homeostasis protein
MESTQTLLEICCGNFQSAVNAEKAGAHRVELCDNLACGGTTPSYGLIKEVRRNLKIPLFILIRPRSGNFVYNDSEISIIEEDIMICKTLKADGVVCGILDRANNIPVQVVKRWVDLAFPMEFTFHKAFDYCSAPFDNIRLLSQIGVKRILTSGGKSGIMDGIDTIAQYIKIAIKLEIIILPGGGLDDTNIADIVLNLHPKELHGSFKSKDTELCTDKIFGDVDVSNISKIEKALSYLLKSS